jgi:hypothetical protein
MAMKGKRNRTLVALEAGTIRIPFSQVETTSVSRRVGWLRYWLALWKKNTTFNQGMTRIWWEN